MGDTRNGIDCPDCAPGYIKLRFYFDKDECYYQWRCDYCDYRDTEKYDDELEALEAMKGLR